MKERLWSGLQFYVKYEINPDLQPFYGLPKSYADGKLTTTALPFSAMNAVDELVSSGSQTKKPEIQLYGSNGLTMTTWQTYLALVQPKGYTSQSVLVQNTSNFGKDTYKSSLEKVGYPENFQCKGTIKFRYIYIFPKITKNSKIQILVNRAFSLYYFLSKKTSFLLGRSGAKYPATALSRCSNKAYLYYREDSWPRERIEMPSFLYSFSKTNQAGLVSSFQPIKELRLSSHELSSSQLGGSELLPFVKIDRDPFALPDETFSISKKNYRQDKKYSLYNPIILEKNSALDPRDINYFIDPYNLDTVFTLQGVETMGNDTGTYSLNYEEIIELDYLGGFDGGVEVNLLSAPKLLF